MLSIAIYVILAVLAAGALTSYLLARYHRELRITRNEFIVGAVVIITVIVPLSSWIGWRIARDNNLVYYENWNGWESGAERVLIKTERDGPGRWTYDCDPYTVIVSYDCGTPKKPQTCYRTETRYHQCPYTTYELNFSAETTLGNFDVANNRLPENPDQHRWRSGVRIPDHIKQSAGVGEPELWRALRERLQQGRPAPVTTRHEYDNYILASEDTLMRKHSGDVALYEKKGLMPRLSRGIFSGFVSPERLFTIGTVPEVQQWKKALAYVNGHLGSVQCDLYVVLANNTEIAENPDRYALALQAYMLDPTRHGKETIAKNAVVVLIGTTDGKFVTYARAFTGMPRGNENVIILIDDNVKGLPFAYELALGDGESAAQSSTTESSSSDFFSGISRRWHVGVTQQTQRKEGVIPRILTGKEVQGVRFRRVSMTGKDGQGGYLYLKNEIRISSSQELTIGLVSFFLSALVWVFFAACDGDYYFNNLLRKLRSHIKE